MVMMAARLVQKYFDFDPFRPTYKLVLLSMENIRYVVRVRLDPVPISLLHREYSYIHIVLSRRRNKDSKTAHSSINTYLFCQAKVTKINQYYDVSP